MQVSAQQGDKAQGLTSICLLNIQPSDPQKYWELFAQTWVYQTSKITPTISRKQRYKEKKKWGVGGWSI